ncbi:MAG: NAD-glutamate dehydrogenase [Pseudomonadota bacterium]
MKEYDFTMQHLYGESHQHITKILNILQASNMEEIFVRKFYATIPMLNPKEDDYALYVELARNAFKFLENYKSPEPKITIYNGKSKTAESNHTIIEILSDEKPFLFDSAMCLLNRLQIDVDRVAHPNIFVKRDKQGNLISIENQQEKDCSQEIIIQIVTSHSLDQDLLKQVETELKNILNLVDYAVNDWKKIVLQIENSTKEFFNYSDKSSDLYQEQKEFLEKMKSKYFVYFGSIEYEFSKGNPEIIQDSILGILKPELNIFNDLIKSTIFETNELLSIGKLNKPSVIHRDANIDYLCLKITDSKGEVKKISVFIGLFTSILYYQSATLIPIIRGKLRYVLEKANFLPTSYAGKELVTIIEALPRDELFQISAEEMYPLLMEIYALLFSPELRLFMRKQGDTLSCILFLPMDLANSQNIKRLKLALSFEYGPIINHHFAQVYASKLCYYHFIIDTKNAAGQINNLKEVETNLRNLTKPWETLLRNLIFNEYGKHKGREYFNKFKQAFPSAYKESIFYHNEILEDIENIFKNMNDGNILFKVNSSAEGKKNTAQLKIYYNEELNLSLIMPILQNLNFNIIAEQIYIISPENEKDIWLHQFTLKIDDNEAKMINDAKLNLEDALAAIWNHTCQNDVYNQLILKANLTHRQITLLRSFAEYLYQVKIGYSKEYIGQVLNKHFDVVKQIIELFYAKFNNKLTIDERKTQSEHLKNAIEKDLSLIHDNIEDQIIRRFIDLVDNVLRTNYFLHDADGQYKDYISLKIDSCKIASIPLPRPFREIFVYSANFEAIHLRGGKVARGGLRWSDRAEDYRTEVLGLMKTQIVKNSVIVPTGSKGGFILKNITGLDREALYAKAVHCYQNFLRGILDITDNIIEGKTHHPKHIVHYDDKDPYLVVAADKGTATFSDIANQISAEYNFWLGDAFASGGSNGYDHKKMGITAKGGWISVMRHFQEMGININKTDFTVVGIGDMSGDVFGNGMLLSEHIRLVGAFNHIHIFIDPNPDSKKSFEERKRLFNLPRSTWLDYNPEILSKGAKIYDRKAKLLELTPEIKERFKLPVDKITPNEMIKVLLTAEVDLLWNGGIGTYVKASFETNEQVGDKTNDNLRCNGSDLKCKIIGEGGNLGLTQYGRIEYARKGGRLNTDAIDNSAGVDCSDHEVNIKIALHQALGKSMITEEERVELLRHMTEDVAELVLKDNRTQTRALTIAEQEGHEILGSQEHFINLLEESEILDRKLEGLPSPQQFAQLHSSKIGLTRPELSVLLAYSKNAIYNNLIETTIPDEEYFNSELSAYFPESMREKFAEIIASHPLRREIITTAITNSMVNRIDTFYLHLTVESTGHKFCDIARAYTITRDVFDLRNLWKEINTLDGLIPVENQSKLYIVIKKFVMRSTSWLLRNYKGKLNIASVISEYGDKIKELYAIIGGCAIGKFKENYNSDLSNFITMSVPSELAKKIAILNLLSSAYNIVEVSNKYKVATQKVAIIYFEIGHRFSLDWLRHCANNLVAENNWQDLAIRGFKDELYDIHRRITASAVELSERSEDGLEKWYKQNDKHIKLFDRFILEVKSNNNIEYAMIDLSLKKLGVLLAK